MPSDDLEPGDDGTAWRLQGAHLRLDLGRELRVPAVAGEPLQVLRGPAGLQDEEPGESPAWSG